MSLADKLFPFLAIYTYSTKNKLIEIFDTDTIKQIDKVDFLRMIDEDKDALVVDLRTPFEYNMSHHPRAININYLSGFKEKITKLDNKRAIFINCETAHRSPYATYLLKKAGFTRIYDLKKGFSQIRKIVKKMG